MLLPILNYNYRELSEWQPINVHYSILVLNIASAVINCETETMYFPEPPLKLVEKVRNVLSLRDICLVMRRIQI